MRRTINGHKIFSLFLLFTIANICIASAQTIPQVEWKIDDIGITPAVPCSQDTIEIEALTTLAVAAPDTLFPFSVEAELFINGYSVSVFSTNIAQAVNCPQPAYPANCTGVDCAVVIGGKTEARTCQWVYAMKIDGTCQWICACTGPAKVKFRFYLGDASIGESIEVSVNLDPYNQLREANEDDNQLGKSFATCKEAFSHTQWSLILLIVIVAGFFGYMILRRRKAVIGAR